MSSARPLSLALLTLLGGCLAEVGPDTAADGEVDASEEELVRGSARRSLVAWDTGTAPTAGLLHDGKYYYVHDSDLWSIEVSPPPSLVRVEPTLLCSSCQPSAITADADTDTIYFTQSHTPTMLGGVFSIPADGGHVTRVASQTGALGVGIGVSDQHVYWPEAGVIKRVAKAGGTPETYLGGMVRSLTLSEGTLCFLGYPGVNCHDLVSKETTVIAENVDVRIPVQAHAGHAYYSLWNGSIWRAPLAGGALEQVKSADLLRRVREILPAGTHVYYVDSPDTAVSERRIRRVPVAGGTGQTLAGPDKSTLGARNLQVGGGEVIWGDQQGIEAAPSAPILLSP